MYELWFRKNYLEPIKNKTMLAAVRPGDRRSPNPKGTREQERIRIRIIEKPGSESNHIPPTFLNFCRYAEITEITVKPIGELAPAELRYCSRDSKTSAQVKQHLFSIYGHSFNDKDIITVLRWKYL